MKIIFKNEDEKDQFFRVYCPIGTLGLSRVNSDKCYSRDGCEYCMDQCWPNSGLDYEIQNKQDNKTEQPEPSCHKCVYIAFNFDRYPCNECKKFSKFEAKK